MPTKVTMEAVLLAVLDHLGQERKEAAQSLLRQLVTPKPPRRGGRRRAGDASGA